MDIRRLSGNSPQNGVVHTELGRNVSLGMILYERQIRNEILLHFSRRIILNNPATFGITKGKKFKY